MPDAHFYLHHYPEQEVLADVLLNKLKKEGSGNPFHRSTVLVRNQGMGTWLNQRMAKQSGLAMQVEFPQPHRFLQRIVGDESINLDDLKWQIYGALSELSARPSFNVIREYLGDVPDDHQSSLKRYQLSGHIAALFDKYLLYRPEWIAAWNDGNKATPSPHEPWQRELWRHMHQNDVKHWSQTLLASQSISSCEELPCALHVFGISNFAPIYVHFLYLLSQQIPVHIYWMNPVGGYWGDGPTKREWILAKAFDDPEVLMHHNPLLASFGRMGREFAHTIYGGKKGNHEVQEEDISSSQPLVENPQTRLQTLQQSLYNNEPIGDAFEGHDASITIHSCHTPLRELETLKTHLLTLAEDKPLDAGDVIVICPDIESYAPAIEAVFGSSQNEKTPRLPYRISDRNSPLTDPNLEAVVRLFSLDKIRFTNREALALISTPAIADHLDLGEEDISTIEEWIQKNGVRWGFDNKHVDRIAPGCVDTPWTWRDGLDRMLLGYAMPQTDDGITMWNDILPFHDIEGSNTRILAAVCKFVDWCSGIRQELETSRTLDQWVEVTRRWIDGGFNKSAQNQELLKPLYRALETIRQQAEFVDEEIPANVFSEHLQEQLSNSYAARGFLSGSITFCETTPMRAIPARAICLLGMNHDTFPRRGSEVQFDLTKSQRFEGDRSTRDDDVYFFLETLLSARESLFISYIGKSIKDGEDRPPSTALQTLVDHIPGLKEDIHVERLHAFDPHYFDHSSPISHDLSLLEAAKILASDDSGREPHTKISITAQEDDRVITIDQFVRSFTNPADQFLRHNLQAQRHYLDSPMEENETLSIDHLTAWQMKSAMLHHRSHLDDRIHAWKQEGLIPTGEIGNKAVEEHLNGLTGILDDLPETELMQITATIEGLTIHGNIPVCEIEGKRSPVVIDPSENKPARQLSTWIYQLLASAASDQPVSSRLLGIKKNRNTGALEITTTLFSEDADYEKHLGSLVKLYQQSQTTPMHHFPNTAEAYWSTPQKESEDADDFEKRRRSMALKKWNADHYSTGESENEAIQLIYDTSDPFTEEFLSTSELIWEPLLNHRSTQ